MPTKTLCPHTLPALVQFILDEISLPWYQGQRALEMQNKTKQNKKRRLWRTEGASYHYASMVPFVLSSDDSGGIIMPYFSYGKSTRDGRC